MLKKFLAVTAVLVAVTAIAYFILISLFPDRYGEYIDEYSQSYGVDKALVCAVIKAESNFDAEARSHKGAVGLMQITPETGMWCADKLKLTEYSEEMLGSPETNIQIGVWYFAYLKEYMGSERLAIMAYNAGMGKVSRWVEEGLVDPDNPQEDAIPYEETKKYLKKVQMFRKIYKRLYNY